MHFAEQLEKRTLLAAVPDVNEQYLICLINRARANPAAEADRYGIPLNEGVPADDMISPDPKSPLAINLNLQQSARDHAQWMVDTGSFSHIGADESTPGDRDVAAGFAFNSPSAWGENIAFSGQLTKLPEVMAAMERLHMNLFVDSGVGGRIHRAELLQDSFREIGVGLVNGDWATPDGTAKIWMLSEDFAYRTGFTFITGVIFADTIRKDGFYTPYEGFGQVSVTATSSTGTVYNTTSWDSGGYSLQVPAGTYRLVFSGGDLPAPVVREGIVVTDENVLQDVDATAMPGMPAIGARGMLTIDGTPGNDRITVESLTDRLRITVNASSWDLPRKPVKRIQVHGGAGNDVIEIGPGLPSSTLYGDGGNDTINGGDGNDRLWGGPGDDRIDGRLGRDLIYGEDGADVLFGGDRPDTIYGGAGNDTIVGGPGNDKLWGDGGNDNIDGQDGRDTIIGGSGADSLIGGTSNDVIKARDGAADTIVTGAGRDIIRWDRLLDIRTNLLA